MVLCMALLNGDNVYKRIRQNFQKADEIYNSGLFHFRDEKGRADPPDTLTLSLHIDDKPIKDIIGNLYYPESPYEFSVLPADILGQVYEQFLGKVIRLTAGHQAKVEDKPEVKKAGGVFYTPTYIVDYIVKNTVGKLVEGKTPKQIEKLKILDPACGSGSFLIQAYQFLIDYHRDWYIKDGIEKHSKGKEPKLVQIRSGEWRLSTPERKKILLNNIHGVDIDTQAVEVTKLSLLLKVLEGENEQSLAQQMTIWHERALPDLENNIKCGNSLIANDYYNTEQFSIFAVEDKLNVNAFDWNNEFAQVFSEGGFDIVIGNPPLWLIRTDSSGRELWNKTYGGPKDDTGFQVVEADDQKGGGFVVVGRTEATRNKRALILKIDGNGSKVWEKTFEDGTVGISIQRSEDGGFVLAGRKDSTGKDGWAAKVSASSEMEWETTFGGAGDDTATSVVADGEGCVVAGITNSYGYGAEDAWLVRIDPGHLKEKAAEDRLKADNSRREYEYEPGQGYGQGYVLAPSPGAKLPEDVDSVPLRDILA